MKNIKFLLLFFLAAGISSAFAQKKEKIKGNRIVKFIQTPIENYNTLEVGEDLEISLVQGDVTMVEVETDENLHEVILFTVANGKLSINTSKRITSSKALNIRVYHTHELTEITAKEDAVVSSLSDLDIERLKINALNDAEVHLTLTVGRFQLNTSEKAEAKLNLTSPRVTLSLSDNSKVEALINGEECTIDMYRSANAKIEGDVKELTLRLDNSAYFMGEKFDARKCTLITEGRADGHISVRNSVSIEASGSTKTYIYNTPKVVLEKFLGSAAVYKKD